MRILKANNFHYIRGGSDSVFFNTATLLEEAGHQAILFATQNKDNKPSPYSSYFPSASEGHSAHPRNFVRFLHNTNARHALVRLLAAEGPFDLAHLHIYYGRLTASILPVLRQAGIPIIQTLHEYKLACPIYTMERHGRTCDACVEGSTLNLLRYSCKNDSLLHSAAMLIEYWASRLQGDISLIDRFICVSDFQMNIMRRAGIPQHKLRRLHNFVDLNSTQPVNQEEKGNYILYFGRIEALKGLPTLIAAAKASGCQLKIAGTGNWQKEMERAISGDKNIEYLGFVSGAPLQSLIAKAKAIIVPSEWYENCPMTVLEAKAAGTLVIGARIGGIPELIRDGIDGFLYTAGDSAALAALIKRLDDIDLAAYAAAARADAEARFSPQAHLAELLAIYDEVLYK